MSIRLVTMDGGHVTPEIDSFLYRALVPRIAPTGLAEDIPAVADYLLYGGQIDKVGVNVYIQKTVMLGCGRIIEIPDSETIQVPSGVSGKKTDYTLVFRIQPSASNASDRIKAVFVPENGAFYSDDISTGAGRYDVKFADVVVDDTGWPIHAECVLPKMPVLTKDAAETKMEIDGQICIPTAEGVRKFVGDQKYFSKNSTEDSIWLLSQISNVINKGEYFSTKEATEALDDLLSAYSVYYPLDDPANESLRRAFNGVADEAFVSAFSFDVDGEVALSVQLALPISVDTNSQMPAIATRYKIAGGDWSEWNTSGSGTGTGSEFPSAENYSVENPYSEKEDAQNLQQTIHDSALAFVNMALQIPHVVTETSAVLFQHGTGEFITDFDNYYEGTEKIDGYIIFPCQEGEAISVLFVGEKNYSFSNPNSVLALNYNFETKKSYVEMPIKWYNMSTYTTSLTQAELADGNKTLTTVKFDVPYSEDPYAPINAIALPLKVVNNSGEILDYSNAFYVVRGSISAIQSKEVVRLKVKDSTYPICDSKARSITDRLFINDNGELFIDGKKYGNN